jgi:ABC-type polysaccharide/polyol phosphate export permease
MVRHLVVLAHNSVIVVLVFLVCSKSLSPVALLAIPGFFIVGIGLLGASVICAIFCVRYRDMVSLVGSLVQILFFVSPILWEARSISDKILFLQLNPLYYWLQITRDPLLGTSPSSMAWTAACLTSFLLLFFATVLLGRCRDRIAYWV